MPSAERRYLPDTHEWVFVFGSNLMGAHGSGASRFAHLNHQAAVGCGRGPTGNAYAIPTFGMGMDPLSLEQIWVEIQEFIRYAEDHPELTFRVSRIGCGNAGYTDEQVAPLFRGAPLNCVLPEAWRPYLEAWDNPMPKTVHANAGTGKLCPDCGEA